MADAIATFGLTKYYGRRLAIDSLDLHIPPGTVYGLLGRNGAGKSTTIKMLLGMSHPTRGRAELLGEDSENLRPATRARIAYLAEGHPLYRWMTIGEASRFTRAFYERYRWNQTLLEQILDHFELSPKRKIRRLSRGQQAQVALALAVASDPELLILDDPTLGLDTVVRRDFLESLIQIIQRRGRTILFSSHILGDVERVADRIGILIDGVLRADCPTDHFKDSLRKISWDAAVDFDISRPELLSCPGLVNCRMVGRRVELVVVGFSDMHRALFKSFGAKNLEVVDFNLEDAFIEYTRGPRRSLPIFASDEMEEEAAQLYLLVAATSPRLPLLPGVGSVILPFPEFFTCYCFISIATAIALGLRQTLGESIHGTHLYLFHRPASRRWLVGMKLAVGAIAYFASGAISIGAYSLWCATPGHLACPFLWGMTVPTWYAWFGFAALYFGAFLSGIRPGSWFLTRLLPLLAAAFFTFLTMEMYFKVHELESVIGTLLVEAAVVAAILFVARTRDYA